MTDSRLRELESELEAVRSQLATATEFNTINAERLKATLGPSAVLAGLLREALPLVEAHVVEHGSQSGTAASLPRRIREALDVPTPEPQSVLAAELAEQLAICGLGCDECLNAGDDVVLDALLCAGLKLVRDPGPTASRAFIERAAG